jgi:hypothetical protein
MNMKKIATIVATLVLLALPALPQNNISRYTFSHLTQATANNPLASKPSELHTVVINASTSGTIQIQDTSAANCSGGTAITGTAAVSAGQTLNYDIVTINGLCIVTGGTVDVTVSWR